jgi:hypothetical protein
VAFISRNQRNSREGHNRRDKGAIVGLSGWLFADLLLGVAVVFLIGSEKPSVNSSADKEDRPTLEIQSVENVQKGTQSTEPWSVNDRSFTIKVEFSEDVRNFGADDLVFQGEANSWVGKVTEPADENAVSDSFLLEIVPSQDLVAGSFEILIPEKSAFSESSGIGNRGKKQKFTVVNCFEYKGIDANSVETVKLSRGFSGGVDYLTSELQKKLAPAITSGKQIGFLILFGGGNNGDQKAKSSGSKVRTSLAELGLVPRSSGDEGKVDACGASLSENDFPMLFYKAENLPESDLQLNIYYLKN